MADTKISNLAAVSVPASTDQFLVNQGGTSKRIALSQMGGLVWVRRLATLVLLATLLLVQPVAGRAFPPNLNGTLVIVASDAVTVTLHGEQTSGEPVTLLVEHFCYDAVHDSVARQTASFVGAADMTFLIGPRTLKGKSFTPTSCWGLLEYQITGNTELIFAEVDTL